MKSTFAIVKRLLASNKISFIITALVYFVLPLHAMLF